MKRSTSVVILTKAIQDKSSLHLQRGRKMLVHFAKQDPCRKVKQEQEENSPNHVQTFFGASVHIWANLRYSQV